MLLEWAECLDEIGITHSPAAINGNVIDENPTLELFHTSIDIGDVPVGEGPDFFCCDLTQPVVF